MTEILTLSGLSLLTLYSTTTGQPGLFWYSSQLEYNQCPRDRGLVLNFKFVLVCQVKTKVLVT